MTNAEITNPEPPVIESASASTACQTSSSKTPYLITGITLGVITLIIAGIAALVVLGVDAYEQSNSSSYYELYPDFDDLGRHYGHDGWDDSGHGWDDDWDNYWDDYWDDAYAGAGSPASAVSLDA